MSLSTPLYVTTERFIHHTPEEEIAFAKNEIDSIANAKKFFITTLIVSSAIFLLFVIYTIYYFVAIGKTTDHIDYNLAAAVLGPAAFFMIGISIYQLTIGAAGNDAKVAQLNQTIAEETAAIAKRTDKKNFNDAAVAVTGNVEEKKPSNGTNTAAASVTSNVEEKKQTNATNVVLTEVIKNTADENTQSGVTAGKTENPSNTDKDAMQEKK